MNDQRTYTGKLLGTSLTLSFSISCTGNLIGPNCDLTCNRSSINTNVAACKSEETGFFQVCNYVQANNQVKTLINFSQLNFRKVIRVVGRAISCRPLLHDFIAMKFGFRSPDVTIVLGVSETVPIARMKAVICFNPRLLELLIPPIERPRSLWELSALFYSSYCYLLASEFACSKSNFRFFFNLNFSRKRRIQNKPSGVMSEEKKPLHSTYVDGRNLKQPPGHDARPISMIFLTTKNQ